MPFSVDPSAPAPDCLRLAARPARNNRADGDGANVDGEAGSESTWQPTEKAGVVMVDELPDRSLPPKDEESHTEDLKNVVLHVMPSSTQDVAARAEAPRRAVVNQL